PLEKGNSYTIKLLRSYRRSQYLIEFTSFLASGNPDIAIFFFSFSVAEPIKSIKGYTISRKKA
ncbi:MAG: hypothetical protein KAU38_10025, partial [Desulfobacterales bacterium]|nr:hypothetical protein [Desulfobacterales bacterium]